jgi:FkbM family methyltransferase
MLHGLALTQLDGVVPRLKRDGWRLEAPQANANRWTAPSGQVVHTFTTRTEPRFVFAYNPLDNDMSRMARKGVLEPAMTLAWHDTTHACCRNRRGIVVDVGGNFGWYTLYSIALGCRVLVLEPVPAWLEILTLGLSLNPGFASRVRIGQNVVYPEAGNFTLHVPKPVEQDRVYLGMTYMNGSAGLIKGYTGDRTYAHVARSIRLDEWVPTDVCLLKADVEGYEPQVLHTAQHVFANYRVHALQLEMTKSTSADQTCASIKALEHLHEMGYRFKIASHSAVDAAQIPPVGSWSGAGGFEKLADFPSTRALAFSNATACTSMHAAYKVDFTSFSTNLFAVRHARKASALPWPTLVC